MYATRFFLNQEHGRKTHPLWHVFLDSGRRMKASISRFSCNNEELKALHNKLISLAIISMNVEDQGKVSS